MAPKLLIIKDDKDHLTKVAHDIVQVLNLYLGTKTVDVLGIHDHNECYDVTNKTFVLFLITDETNSFENQVPKWLCEFENRDKSKLKLKYLVVREIQTYSGQTQETNRNQIYWIENERKKCGTADNIIDVDHIGSVLQWWPSVIRRFIKTRDSKYKIDVVTDNKQEVTSDADLNIMRITKDTTCFLKDFQAFAEKPRSSTNYKLFIVGDSYQFHANHGELKTEKVNGCKIVLILVRERIAPELKSIATSLICLSNMIHDILQLMVDLEIVPESQGFKKTKQTETRKDIASKETSASEEKLVKIYTPNMKLEDLKTTNMASPVSQNHACKMDAILEIIQVIILPFALQNLLEYLAVCLIALPLIIVAYMSGDEDKERIISEIVIPSLVLVEKIAMAIFIPVYFGPIYAIPAVANLIFPPLLYVYFNKDFIKKSGKVCCLILRNNVNRCCRKKHCM